MAKEKHALLDTDFISKMHIVRKNEQSPMMDRIMELPGYQFYCHFQIKKELGRHNIAGSKEWMDRHICSGDIRCYTDEEIISELECYYGLSAVAVYAQLLETACEAYQPDYFANHFSSLMDVDYTNITKEQFIEKLDTACDALGEGQNLGEIKSYVLLQTLSLILGEQIYVFCSDDRNARSGVISIGNVQCISVLSAFLRLQKECDLQKEEATPYIEAWLEFCASRNQTIFKVQDASKERRFCKVPCRQVMDEIYEGKFEELPTGVLRYR